MRCPHCQGPLTLLFYSADCSRCSGPAQSAEYYALKGPAYGPVYWSTLIPSADLDQSKAWINTWSKGWSRVPVRVVRGTWSKNETFWIAAPGTGEAYHLDYVAETLE